MSITVTVDFLTNFILLYDNYEKNRMNNILLLLLLS